MIRSGRFCWTFGRRLTLSQRGLLPSSLLSPGDPSRMSRRCASAFGIDLRDDFEGETRKENLRLSYDIGHYSFAQSGIVKSCGCETILRQFFCLEEGDQIPNKELTLEEWSHVCAKAKVVNERKFRTVFVTAMLEYLRLKELNRIGQSFIEFLIEKDLFLSAVQVGAAIRFYAGFKNVFTEADFLRLVKLLDKTSKPSVSFYLSQKLAALSFTSRVDECLSIIQELKAANSESAPQYSCAVRAAACRNKADVVVDLLKQMGDKGFRVAEDTMLEVINFWARSSQADEGEFILESLMICLGRNQQVMSEAIASAIQTHFASLGHNVASTTVTRGVCPKCQTQMDSLELSEIDMAVLKAKLFDVNFLSSVYATTTPQELDNFSFYLKRQKPYDIVVDGLNIMYRRTQLCDWRAANKLNTSMLLLTVKTLKKEFPRILVIGKLHMYLEKEIIKQIKELGDVYLVDNESKDDPFILMAAINHPDTFFLSGDFFSDHKSKLPLAEQVLYQKWDRMRHVYIGDQLNSQTGKKKIQLMYPQTWEIRPQKSAAGMWHIPFMSGKPLTPSTPTNTWLCVQPKGTR